MWCKRQQIKVNNIFHVFSSKEKLFVLKRPIKVVNKDFESFPQFSGYNEKFLTTDLVMKMIVCSKTL